MSYIVVDVGGSGTRIGTVSEDGVTSIRREPLNSLESLVAAIKKRSPRTPVKGLAISVAGFVDSEKGQVLMSRNAAWLEGELKSQIHKTFSHANIHIINDGEAHALALLGNPQIKLGALNVAVGTSLALGVLDRNGRVIRTASGTNWDIGDLWVKTSATEPYAWWALGKKGIEELQRRHGDNAYKYLGYRLGAFLSQLATIFRPHTIGLSGGHIVHHWKEMQTALLQEFKNPVALEPRIVAQQEAESALTGLGLLLKKDTQC